MGPMSLFCLFTSSGSLSRGTTAAVTFSDLPDSAVELIFQSPDFGMKERSGADGQMGRWADGPVRHTAKGCSAAAAAAPAQPPRPPHPPLQPQFMRPANWAKVGVQKPCLPTAPTAVNCDALWLSSLCMLGAPMDVGAGTACWLSCLQALEAARPQPPAAVHDRGLSQLQAQGRVGAAGASCEHALLLPLAGASGAAGAGGAAAPGDGPSRGRGGCPGAQAVPP